MSFNKSFCFLFLFLPAFVTQATANCDLAQMLKVTDQLIAKPASYAEQLGSAREVLAEAKRTGEEDYQARALIRMVYIELNLAKWGPRWTEWRQRAQDLMADYQHPNLALAEVEAINGYLDAMYFGEVRSGIDAIQNSITAAETLDDDAFLSLANYWLGRVLVFDGRDKAALEASRLSALFAQNIGDDLQEYKAMSYSMELMDVLDIEPNTELTDRFRTVSKRLGNSSYFTKSEEEKLIWLHQIADSYESLSVKPVQEHVQQFYEAQFALLELSYREIRSENWAQAERNVRWYTDCAEKLQNNVGKRTGDFLLAGLHVRKGAADYVDDVCDAFVTQQQQLFRTNELSRMSQWMAEQYVAHNDSENALKWYQLANTHGENDLDARSSSLGASARFQSLMKQRELRNQLRTQEQRLLNQRWAAVSILSAGLIVCLILRTYTDAHRQEKLQSRIDAQTSSLRIAKEQAEAENLAKTEFVARINHEIRNPLTAIVASSELLSMDCSPEDQQESRLSLRASTNNLLSVIDDVLDFAKIESGKMTLDATVFAPRELLKSLAAMIRPQLKDGVTIHTCCADIVPKHVVTDARKIRQVLLNLCHNSAKYTEHGGIEIYCDVAASQVSPLALKWEVRDTGIGMSEQQTTRVFERFESNDWVRGTGLGLYICKAFVECLNGTIECHSEHLAGTQTIITVPVTQAEDAWDLNQKEPMPRRIDATSVLIIDDEEANRNVLMKLLTNLGYSAQAADGWSDVERIPLSMSFEFVLLDIRMPKMDGFKVLERLKVDSRFRNSRIFAMTGDATDDRRIETEEAGFDGFLAKPFTISRLADAIGPEQRQVTPKHSNAGT